MKLCEFTEAAPDDPAVVVNPMLVRLIRSHGDNTEIVLDADLLIIVSDSLDVVLRRLEQVMSD